MLSSRRQFSLILLAGMMAAAGGCADSTPDYRYRLTVEVETPEGIRSGSGVIGVRTFQSGERSIPTPGAVSHRLRGQAVAVDLGRRGMLFALLRSDDSVDWAKNLMFRLAPAAPITGHDGKNLSEREAFEHRYAAMLKMQEPIEVPRRFPDVAHLRNISAWPLFARFDDLNDPTTIARVDPDDLTQSFGEGVRIKRVVVQITDEPVSEGIENILPWLPDKYNLPRDFQPEGIQAGDFRGLFIRSKY